MSTASDLVANDVNTFAGLGPSDEVPIPPGDMHGVPTAPSMVAVPGLSDDAPTAPIPQSVTRGQRRIVIVADEVLLLSLFPLLIPGHLNGFELALV